MLICYQLSPPASLPRDARAQLGYARAAPQDSAAAMLALEAAELLGEKPRRPRSAGPPRRISPPAQ